MGAPPPGYVNYNTAQVGNIQPSKGLSKAMIILYWAATGAAGLLAVAAFMRKGTWDDLVSGNATLSDIDSADSFVGVAAVLQILLVIASAIVTCLWSKRIADNAVARGVTNVKPGMAAGGWFIPIGWFWLGFKELRKSGEGTRADVSALQRWQGFFIGQSVLGIVSRNFGNFDTNDSSDTISAALRNQWMVALVAAALYAAATVFATKAAKSLDEGVSGA